MFCVENVLVMKRGKAFYIKESYFSYIKGSRGSSACVEEFRERRLQRKERCFDEEV